MGVRADPPDGRARDSVLVFLARRAVTGLVRAARRAGSRAATRATASSAMGVATNQTQEARHATDSHRHHHTTEHADAGEQGSPLPLLPRTPAFSDSWMFGAAASHASCGMSTGGAR